MHLRSCSFIHKHICTVRFIIFLWRICFEEAVIHINNSFSSKAILNVVHMQEKTIEKARLLFNFKAKMIIQVFGEGHGLCFCSQSISRSEVVWKLWQTSGCPLCGCGVHFSAHRLISSMGSQVFPEKDSQISCLLSKHPAIDCWDFNGSLSYSTRNNRF